MSSIVYLTDVEFGPESIAKLPSRLARLQIRRQLSVSDHSIVAAGLVDKIASYLPPRDNPPSEAIALDCATCISTNVRTAYRDGSDLTARTALMMGSPEGGLTFQKGPKRALALHSHATNPVPLTANQYRQLLLAVMY